MNWIFGNSLDSLLAVLEKILVRLLAHVDTKNAEANGHRTTAQEYQNKANAAVAEATRAFDVAHNLQKLLAK